MLVLYAARVHSNIYNNNNNNNNNNIALLEPLNSPFGVQSTSVGEHWVIALKTQMQKHHSLIIS